MVANKKARSSGTPAKRQAVTNPKETIFSAKRFIGRKKEWSRIRNQNVPYEVTAGSGGESLITFNGKNARPEEISAHVLMKLKAEDAEKYLGEAVTEAVITVPAYFNDEISVRQLSMLVKSLVRCKAYREWKSNCCRSRLRSQ